MTDYIEPRTAYVVLSCSLTATRVVLFGSLRATLVTEDRREAHDAMVAWCDSHACNGSVVLSHGAMRVWEYHESLGVYLRRQPPSFLTVLPAYLAPADYWALMDAVRHVSDPELDERPERDGP